MQQAVERFEHGQVRLGAGEPLRAAAAHQERALRQLCELRQEVLDEDRLADARLAHDRQDPAAALARVLVGTAERRAFVLASDGTALGDCRAAMKRRRPRVTRGERRQFLLDLARRRAHRRILRDHPVHELLDPGGHRRVQPRQRHGIFQQDRRQHGGHRRSHPRPASGEHLVDRDAKREDVRRRARGIAARLLGRHVGHRPEQRTWIRLHDFLRRRRRSPGVGNAGQPEVQHLHVAVAAHHHVLGLDVAMDDARGVGGGQRLRDLPAESSTVDSAIGPSIFARSVAPSMNSWTM